MRLRSTRLTAIANAVRNLFYGAALNLRFDNTSTLDPRITFTRTTNATVTGSNGLIQNAPMNLLTFSEQFDNAAWGKLAATVTANTTAAPNGTVTADTISLTSNLSNVAQAVSLGAGTYTFSVWVKTLTFTVPGALRILLVVDGGSQILTFTPTAEWTRQTFTVTAATSVTSVQAVRGSVYVGDIAIWGAQLELGSTAGTYNPTTVKNLLGFTEHFDNAAWTKSNSFVQTNLLTFSQDFDNAVWSKNTTTITANTTTAPDGSTTADKLIVDNGASNASSYVKQNYTKAASPLTLTSSFYAKAGEFNRVRLNIRDNASGSNNANVTVSLVDGSVVSAAAANGTFSAASATVSDVGNNWYRIALTFTTGSETIIWGSTLFAQDSVATTGDGTSGIFIWGAQLVQGTTPGDYKATYAAAAAVGYTDIYGQPFAQKLVENTATDQHAITATVTTSNAPFTLGIYAKAAERNWLFIRINDSGGTSRRSWFNLATGVVGNVGANLTAAITDVGNGWYRCSITVSSASASSQSILFGVSNADNTTSYTGDGTSGIYIFGAQLSDSASVDPYVYQPVAASASTAYYGPRFDYDPVTLAPKGLLVEEQRSNLLTYSSDFSNAVWVKSADVTVSAGVTAPDGGASQQFTVTASTTIGIRQEVAVAATSATYTIYAKQGSGATDLNKFILRNTSTATNLVNISIDYSTGVVTGDGGSATSAGNGWWRIQLVAATGITSGNLIRVFVGGVGGTETAGEFAYFWGAQLEAGAFATSYIPTVASQVTRAADSASIIGNNFARWYNQTQGTVFAEYSVNGLNPGTANAAYGITDNTINNHITGRTSASGTTNFQVRVGGVNQAALNSVTTAVGAVVKSAGAYALNDFSFTANAGTVQTDTSGTLPFVTQMQIGGLTSSENPLNGHLARLAFYNRRLANTELQGITA
jgi:hypothetical protein